MLPDVQWGRSLRNGNALFHLACMQFFLNFFLFCEGGSVAEWLACWTQARAWVQITGATLTGNSLG